MAWSRRAFVVGGTAVAATALVGGGAVARDDLDDDVVQPLVDRPTRVLDDLALFERFPEGPLYGPAFALMTLRQVRATGGALRDDDVAASARALGARVRAGTLIALARRGLAGLDDTEGQGTWCGMACLALAAAHELGDPDAAAFGEALARALGRSIAARQGAPIDSYPRLVWPFDTAVAHAAVARWPDATPADDRAAWLDAHLRWLDGHLDPSCALPVSQVDASGRTKDGARGCDLSLRLPLLAWIAPVAAARWWTRYREAFLQPGFPGGLREWPKGVERAADHDSGPIVMGVGATATALGIAAARASGDLDTEAFLRRRMALARRQQCLALSLVGGPGCTDPDVIAMAAYGDLCLAWACTWAPWAG